MEVLSSIPWVQQFKEPNVSFGRKIIWTIIFLICSVSTIILIVDRIQLYRSQPVNHQFQFEQPNFYSFPSVTICPAHQFDPLVMNQKAKLNNFTTKSFSSVYELLPEVSLNDIWSNAAESMTDVVTQCYYTGYLKCPLNPWYTQLTVIGVCHTISLNYIPMNITDVLTVTVRLNDSWSPIVQPHDSKWKFLVHDYNEDITYSIMPKSIAAPNSSNYIIYFEQTYHTHEHSSMRPCLPYDKYIQCENKCMDNFFLGNRTCRLPFMKTVHLPLCDSEADFRAMYKLPFSKRKYTESLSFDCHCNRPCNYFRYKIFIDSLNSNGMDVNLTRFAFRPVNAGREITSETFYYGFVKLLCDIGAVLGFHMGISLLTLTEVIVLIVECVLSRIMRTTKK